MCYISVVVVVIAQQLFLSLIVKVEKMMLDDAGDDTRRVRDGDTELFAAIVLDGRLLGTVVDMPCQGLLSTFFSMADRRIHQKYIIVLWLTNESFGVRHSIDSCKLSFISY